MKPPPTHTPFFSTFCLHIYFQWNFYFISYDKSRGSTDISCCYHTIIWIWTHTRAIKKTKRDEIIQKIIDCLWKCMESCIGTENLVFCSGYSSSKCTKGVQGTWHSPNTLITMLQDQCFRVMAYPSHSHRADTPFTRHLGTHWAALWALDPWEPSA